MDSVASCHRLVASITLRKHFPTKINLAMRKNRLAANAMFGLAAFLWVRMDVLVEW